MSFQRRRVETEKEREGNCDIMKSRIKFRELTISINSYSK